MPKHNILHELVDCIENICEKSNTKVTRYKLILFLLGENIENIDPPLSHSELYKLYSGERLLSSSDILSHLINSSDWSIGRFIDFVPFGLGSNIIPQLIESIKVLFSKYFPDATESLDFSIMIQSLVYLHFFGTDDIDLLFYPCQKKACSNYIPWSEKELELSQALEQCHLLFITGLPASGKTQLVRHYIETSQRWDDTFFLNIKSESFLKNRIEDIKFLCRDDEKPLSFEDVLENLSYKSSSSLLVIDIPFMKNEDYDFINQYLLSMDLYVITTTRTTDIPSDYKTVNIDHRPVKNLLDIFNSFEPKISYSNETFQKLCKIISYNPLAITLISKTLRKVPSKFRIDEFLETSSWFISSKNNPKIHSSYQDTDKKSGLQIQTLICRILNDYEKDFLKNTGSELSVLAKDEIPFNLLAKDIDIPDLEKALDYGLIQFIDAENTIVQMPSIIADVIWQEYPINYYEYKERIFQYLHDISIGQTTILSYNTLYNHIFTMIYRFHYQITKMKSRPDKNSKLTFKEWNHLLCEFILYFIRLGNTTAAQKCLYNLYVYESKNKLSTDLVPSLQLWERKVFQLHIDFAKNENPIETIDKASHFLKELLSQTDKENSPMSMSIYISIIEKTYDFIMDMLDTLVLKFLLVSTGTDLIQTLKIDCNTITVLKTFLKSYFTKDDFWYYYQMLFFFLSRQYDLAEAHFKKIATDSPLIFKGRLWKFYYCTILVLHNNAYHKSAFTSEQLDFLAQEYVLLYEEFHNRITSFNTSILFYYCTIICNYLLPFTYPYTLMLTRKGLSKAYDSITSQSFLSEKDKDRMLVMIQRATAISKAKIYSSIKLYPASFYKRIEKNSNDT